MIQGLHELGLGFKIALRDLEIRGAGNLLGTEQHGAIAAVGFEMYLQMLQSAVAKLRSGAEEEALGDVLSTAEMNLDLPLDHFIPRSYIRDERLRLGAYRQLADAEDEESLEAVLRSLRDRYGSPPPQLDNLVYSLRVKQRGQRLGVRSLIAEGRELVIRVDPDRFLDVDELARRFTGRLAVRPNTLRLRRQGEGWRPELLACISPGSSCTGGVMRPLTIARPDVGIAVRARILSRVVLPPPSGPISATLAPGGIAIEMSRNAQVSRPLGNASASPD